MTGCTSENLPAPMCRVDTVVAQDISANAGCIIRVRNSLVTITHKRSDKLDIPGGTSDGKESAACTAHRETWEETGFNVEVKQLLGKNENGFHYYACQLSGDFTGEITEFPLPDSARGEVTQIRLLDPFDITEQQWRFRNRLPALREMFNKTGKKPSTELKEVQ